MPFTRIGAGLVYFAHVPKCAGTSIEDYLEQRFGRPLGFRDGAYLSHPEEARWTRTSPQHIAVADLKRLMPLDLFSAVFTMVRHPFTRAQSVYRFQKVHYEAVPPEMGFSEWLSGLPDALRADRSHLDNHVRPMTEIVPEGAYVFRLEDGMAPIVAWIDELAGNVDGPRYLKHMKSHRTIHERKGVPVEEITLTPADTSLLRALYADDFDRFGYDPDELPGVQPRPASVSMSTPMSVAPLSSVPSSLSRSSAEGVGSGTGSGTGATPIPLTPKRFQGDAS